MATVKALLIKNLFTLVLSVIGSITAGIYSCLFQHPTHWEIAWWVIPTFIIFYLTTYFTAKFLRKITSTGKRIFSYSLYSLSSLFLCIFFIYPIAFLLTGPIVEDNKHSICCETPLEYGAADYQSLKFKMKDSIVISGWYIPPPTHKNSLIILIHGHYADRRATQEWAKPLIKAGYSIYMYDLRGHGESEGVLDYVHSDYSADLLEIKAQLANQYPIKQFGVVGLSMGAHALINAVAKDNTAFKAVWLDGLWPQAPEDLDIFLPSAYIYSNLDFLTQIIFTNPAPRLEPLLDTLTQNKSARIMVVSAGAEEMESSVGRKLGSTKSNLIDNWVIPKALHLNGISIAPEEYQQKLLDFFKPLQD